MCSTVGPPESCPCCSGRVPRKLAGCLPRVITPTACPSLSRTTGLPLLAGPTGVDVQDSRSSYSNAATQGLRPRDDGERPAGAGVQENVAQRRLVAWRESARRGPEAPHDGADEVEKTKFNVQTAKACSAPLPDMPVPGRG